MLSRQGREASTIFSAALTVQCRVLWQDVVQTQYHSNGRLVRMLSMVPLQKVCMRGGWGCFSQFLQEEVET